MDISINVPAALVFLYAEKQCRKLSEIFELLRLILYSAKHEYKKHLIDVAKEFEDSIKKRSKEKRKSRCYLFI